jgi:hypothetical protein
MSNRNQVTGSFPSIAVFDPATSNVPGIAVGNLSVTGANAYFSNIANLHVPGGSANQFIKTDGTGNLSWGFGGLTFNSGLTNTTVRSTQFGSLGNTTLTTQSPTGTAVSDFISIGSVFTFSGDAANLYTVTGITGAVLNSANLAFTPALTQGYTSSTYLFSANINPVTSLSGSNTIQVTLSNGVATLTSAANVIYFGTTSVSIPSSGGDVIGNSAGNISLFTQTNGNISVTANGTGNLSLFGNNFTALTANTGNINETAAANINWLAGGLGTTSVPAASFTGTRLLLSRGSASQTTAGDEYLTMGSNTASSNTLVAFNTAGSQYAGIRYSRGGAEKWYTGLDNTRADGNYVITAPTGNTDTSTPIKIDSVRGVTYTLAPSLVWGAAGVNQNAQSNTTFYPTLFAGTAFNPPGSRGSTVTEAEMGVTRDTNSPYTVTFNTAGLYLITVQVAFAPNTTGSRMVVFSSDSSANMYAGVNIIQQTNGGTATYPTTIQGAAPVYCRAGDQYTLKVLQNSGANLVVGGTAANLCTLTITRL